MATATLSTHYKCRNGVLYQRSDVVRQPVSDDKVSWHQAWDDYGPPFYIAPSAKDKPWADPADMATLQKEDGEMKSSAPVLAFFSSRDSSVIYIDSSCIKTPYSDGQAKPPMWNCLDGTVDRRSHLGLYEVVAGLPRNPIGRTGIAGRGFLGRWGPNHAADPIVTRWKTTASGDDDHAQRTVADLDNETNLPILQFVAIQRSDTKEWAIPGGMIDPGELVSKTLQREFEEEALNCLEMTDEERKIIQEQFRSFFLAGTEIYKGYIDDPRNTDNAWIETVAMNFHDELGTAVGRLQLKAGDDAVQVQWMDVRREMELYANHAHLLKTVTGLLKAHW